MAPTSRTLAAFTSPPTAASRALVLFATSLGIATTSDYNGEFTGVTSGWTIINSGDTIGAYGLSVSFCSRQFSSSAT